MKHGRFLGLLVLAGAAFLAQGCASPNAGGTATGISITIYADRFSGPGPSEAFVKIEGQDAFGTATAAPETSGQTASTSTTPTLEVPVTR